MAGGSWVSWPAWSIGMSWYQPCRTPAAVTSSSRLTARSNRTRAPRSSVTHRQSAPSPASCIRKKPRVARFARQGAPAVVRNHVTGQLYHRREAATSRLPIIYPAGVTVRAMLISMRRMVSPLVVALVIEDEPTRRAIRRALGRPEVIVAPFRTAERALPYLDTIAVDLLVTDFELAGLSGSALIATTRARGHRYPTVLITSRSPHDRAEDLARYHLADVDIVEKPMGPSDTQRVIARYLTRTHEDHDLA